MSTPGKKCLTYDVHISIALHTALSLKKDFYMCNFGCNIINVSAKEITSHFITKHTRAELEMWGMSYDLLAHNLNTSK